MKHILIAVGCDTYDHCLPLQGAENDATKIFSLLTNAKYGFCDTTTSALILSPSLQGLQQALQDATRVAAPGDIVTFYFAGHGHVKNNIFYMCCKDTNADRLGVSAFPLNNLLSLFHEIAPRHANVIIDACNSGGVMGDFSRALSPDTIGRAETIGITLLAACALDQFAEEADGEGICTTIVARCIEGTIYVQDLDSALDLTSIAAEVSRVLEGSNQQPTFWGLNLTGRPNFCVNQHFLGDNELRRTLAEARPMAASPSMSSAIRSVYDELETEWCPFELQRALAMLPESRDDAASRLSFLNSLAGAMQQRAKQANDPILEIEVAVTCLAPLIECCEDHPLVEGYVVDRCADLAERTIAVLEEIHSEIAKDPFALLGNSGVGELFVVPLRISGLLGWLGWAILVLKQTGRDPSHAEQFAQKFVRACLDGYSGSFKAMCDTQASALLVFATAIKPVARDELEEILGLYFFDLCESRGVIARDNLEAAHIVDFLLAKHRKDFSARELVANPSTLLFALLLLASDLELDEAFDPGMIDLDYQNANAFMPSSYADFSRDRIERGYNATFQIGQGVWRVQDIKDKWSHQMMRPSASSTGVLLLSAACSLVFPDRVAWHLCDGKNPLNAAA